jgi:hypothetical protein
MEWSNTPEEERQSVLDVLEREAERLEQDAVQMQVAAQRLGRPSIVERQELKANAFRAAIDALRAIVRP